MKRMLKMFAYRTLTMMVYQKGSLEIIREITERQANRLADVIDRMDHGQIRPFLGGAVGWAYKDVARVHIDEAERDALDDIAQARIAKLEEKERMK